MKHLIEARRAAGLIEDGCYMRDAHGNMAMLEGSKDLHPRDRALLPYTPYHVDAGDHIHSAIAKALYGGCVLRGDYPLRTRHAEWCVKQGMPVPDYPYLTHVEMSFNGAHFRFNLDCDADTCFEFWQHLSDTERQLYKNSAEYHEFEEKRRLRREEAQNAYNNALAALTLLATMCESEKSYKQPSGKFATDVFKVLYTLVDCGDHVGVAYDREEVCKLLEKMNYRQSQYIGDSLNDPDTNITRAWVAGQVIHDLRVHNMYCPAALAMIDKYFLREIAV